MVSGGIVANNDVPKGNIKFRAIVQKVKDRNAQVAPDADTLRRVVIAEFSRFISSKEKRGKETMKRPSIGSSRADHEQIR